MTEKNIFSQERSACRLHEWSGYSTISIYVKNRKTVTNIASRMETKTWIVREKTVLRGGSISGHMQNRTERKEL